MTAPAPRTLTADGVRVAWRPTPWDARGLGVATVEVVAIDHASAPAAALPAALAALDAALIADRVGLATVRVPAADHALVGALAGAGFARVETSHPMTLDLGARDPREAFRRAVAVEPARAGDRDELVALARDGFDYSRFHEDPRIHPARARARYARWIADSLHNGDEVWIHRHAGAIAAVMSFRRSEPRAEGGAAGGSAPGAGRVQLYLGGTRPGANPIAAMFWTGVLARLRDEGVTTVVTRVSAANTAALRLHAALGFVITGTDAGCTKIYPAGAVVGSPPEAAGDAPPVS